MRTRARAGEKARGREREELLGNETETSISIEISCEKKLYAGRR